MRTRSLLHSCAALWLAMPVVAQDNQTRAGKCFTVVLHAGKLPEPMVTRFADEVLALAESTLPALDRLQLKPGKPQTIHVYADETEYRAAEKKLDPKKYQRESFCLETEAAAHVAFWPPFDAKDLEVTGLPVSTRHSVILQAAQLAVFDRSENAQADDWRAGVIAQAVLESTVYPGQAVGVDPVYDTRRWFHADLFKKGEAPKLRQLSTAAPAPTSQGDWKRVVGEQCCMAQLCAATGAGWARRLLAVSAKPSTKTDPRMAAVEAVLGKDWNKNEASFSKLLAASRARWWVPSPMVEVRGERLLLAGTEDVPAVLEFLEPVPKGSYAVRGTATLLAGREIDLRVQLDWDDESLIGCFIESKQLRVQLFTKQSGKWQLLKAAPSLVPVGRPFTFEVEVGERLSVAIDGKRLMEVDYGKRTMRGTWSVAKNDGPVWLQDLRIEALPAAGK